MRRIAATRNHRVPGHQRVAAERLAIEEHAAREPERGIKAPLERGIEPRHVDAEIAQQAFCRFAPQRPRRLDRLAAAVADDEPPIERELVALGVTAEIVVIVEHEDARIGAGRAAVEPRRSQSADAATDDDEIVAFLDRCGIDAEALPLPRKRMRNLERAGMLTAQAGQRRRVARRVGRNLRGRRQARCNRQGGAVEEVAAGDGRHAPSLARE